MRKAITVFLFLIAASPVCAQRTSIYLGGKIGVPINRNASPQTIGFGGFGQMTITPEGPRIAMAPTFTLFVDNRLAVDVEALFRPIRFERDTIAPTIGSFEKTRATSLEFPVILSYHFGRESLRPWAGAGLIPYEKSWGRIDSRNIIHDQGDRETHVVFTFYGSKPTTPPVILSAGLDYSWKHWMIRPEIRYTHSAGSSGRNRNQWDALVGVMLPVFEHR